MPAFWRTRNVLAGLLWPLSLVFAFVTALRRRWQQGKAKRLPVPVVVVGNITVGGNGKTPVVIALVRALQARGWQAGVVSGGYGGAARARGEVCLVSAHSKAAITGDEPLLIARETQAPVMVGRDRAAAVAALLEAFPELDVVIADDGLQHYRLARSVEWVVMAADFGVGNGWLLPAGPLRESAARIREADALLVNGDGRAADNVDSGAVPRYRLPAATLGAYRLQDGAPYALAAGEALYLLTAIARGERVRDSIHQAGGMVAEARYLPDHAALMPQAAAFAGEEAPIVVTAKDAVKLDDWPHELRARVIVLDYRLHLPDTLLDTLEGRLRQISAGFGQ